MTDAEKMFRQTSKERKNPRGVWAKKSGSRSKRCSLPSDNLTAKQRKELNGAVKEYSLNKPLYWTEFLQLPKDLQLEYMDKLINKLHARRVDVVGMFWVSQSTFNLWLKKNYSESPFDSKSSPKRVSDEFAEFLALREPEQEDLQEPVEEENVQQEAPKSVKQPLPKDDELLRVISGILNYEGDPAAIFQKALLALDPRKSYAIQIAYQVKESK